jgi:hypothetical protein
MFIMFKAESPMSGREAVDALSASVSRMGWLRKHATPFTGRVWESGFRISCVMGGRDSFNPILFGRFSPSEHGTRVRVVMTLHPIVWVFLALWTILIDCLAFSRGRITLVGVIVLLLPWLIGIPLFFYNVVRSKRLLWQCLEMSNHPPNGQHTGK